MKGKGKGPEGPKGNWGKGNGVDEGTAGLQTDSQHRPIQLLAAEIPEFEFAQFLQASGQLDDAALGQEETHLPWELQAEARAAAARLGTDAAALAAAAARERDEMECDHMMYQLEAARIAEGLAAPGIDEETEIKLEEARFLLDDQIADRNPDATELQMQRNQAMQAMKQRQQQQQQQQQQLQQQQQRWQQQLQQQQQRRMQEQRQQQQQQLATPGGGAPAEVRLLPGPPPTPPPADGEMGPSSSTSADSSSSPLVEHVRPEAVPAGYMVCTAPGLQDGLLSAGQGGTSAAPTEATEREKVVQLLRQNAGADCAKLPSLFEREFGRPLAYKELGYKKLQKFLAKIPGVQIAGQTIRLVPPARTVARTGAVKYRCPDCNGKFGNWGLCLGHLNESGHGGASTKGRQQRCVMDEGEIASAKAAPAKAAPAKAGATGAAPPTAAAAAAAAAVSVAEKRIDPSDGQHYAWAEFQQCYGGRAAALWKEAGRLMKNGKGLAGNSNAHDIRNDPALSLLLYFLFLLLFLLFLLLFFLLFLLFIFGF